MENGSEKFLEEASKAAAPFPFYCSFIFRYTCLYEPVPDLHGQDHCLTTNDKNDANSCLKVTFKPGNKTTLWDMSTLLQFISKTSELKY